jgi:Polysaccharide biosynthesis enzyme WcbI
MSLPTANRARFTSHWGSGSVELSDDEDVGCAGLAGTPEKREYLRLMEIHPGDFRVFGPLASMPSSIVVSSTSNCQIAGIAAAMRQIFPKHRIVAIDLRKRALIDRIIDTALRKPSLAKILRNADVWFTLDRKDIDKISSAERLNFPNLQIINVPAIEFTAFHPDIVYASDAVTGKLTKIGYNSLIAAWAYNNNLDAEAASLLYKAEVFDQLGYYHHWASSVRRLQAVMEECTLDFRGLFLHIKRRGAFMHTFNHPKQFVLTRLAQIASGKANIPSNILETPLDVIDGLTEPQWPVYPEIGDFYSLNTSYVWRFKNIFIDGLIEYLRFAFSNYEKWGIRRGNLKIHSSLPAAQCDEILRGFIRDPSQVGGL